MNLFIIFEIYLTTLPTLPIKNFQYLKNGQSSILEIFAIVLSANHTNTDVKFIKNGYDILQLFVCILDSP